MSEDVGCELCVQPGGEELYRDANYRIVLVDDPLYPGFCRVIWNAHVREMTDLSTAERAILIAAVWQVEEAVREAMAPYKINVASFGNVVPHLHWHVIPRYEDDTHFPNPIWGEKTRAPSDQALAERRRRAGVLRENIQFRFRQSLL